MNNREPKLQDNQRACQAMPITDPPQNMTVCGRAATRQRWNRIFGGWVYFCDDHETIGGATR